MLGHDGEELVVRREVVVVGQALEGEDGAVEGAGCEDVGAGELEVVDAVEGGGLGCFLGLWGG